MRALEYLVLFLALILFSERALGESTLLLDDRHDRYAIGLNLEYYEDKTNQLTFADITSESWHDKFRPSQSKAPNFGHTRSDIWVRVTLRNESVARDLWLLEIQSSRLVKADVYLVDPADGSFEVKAAHDFQPYSARAVAGRNFNLKIEIPPGRSRTLLVNAAAYGTLQLPLVLWTPEAFAQADHHQQLLMGVYYGMILAILLVNAMAYFTIRDKLFLYYSAYLASFGALQFGQNGHLLEYVTPWDPDLMGYLFMVAMGLTSVSALEFTRKFLDLPSHMPRTSLLARTIVLLWVFDTWLVWHTGDHAAVQFGTLLVLLTAGTLLAAAVAMRNRVRQGRYFLVAWSGFLVGTLALGLRNLDILPNNFITTHGMQIGSFFEFVLLTYALTDRIRATKKENERIQREAMLTLEKRVDERTRELVEQREVAEQATRFKSEFLANMSHEIRTPMNAIVGLTHLALGTELSAKQRSYVSGVTGAARSLLNIIEDVLDFSKIEAGKLQLDQIDFDLGAVVENISTMTSLQAQDKGLALTFWMDAGVERRLKGDPQRLGQVLLNLVNNAIKFTDAGQVQVRISQAHLREGGLKLICSVTDTGIGISQREMGGLFQSFNQADRSITRRFGGTGLGLAISQQLAQAMGGRIDVESVPNQGSTFTFTAVLAPSGLEGADAAPVDPAPAGRIDDGQAALKLRGAQVLVVEDHEINRLVLQELLQSMGAACHLAASGRAAIEMALDPALRHDLVLMDLQMPDMSGLQACKEIRRHIDRGRLPIIALTAQAEQGLRQRCLDAGMNDFLTKPLDPAKLQQTIAWWLGRTDPRPSPADRPDAGGAASAPVDMQSRHAKRLPQPLPGFDGLPAALSRVNGNEALLRRLIVSFHEKFKDFAPRLRVALQDGDGEAAVQMAHTLKGVAGTLGAHGVAQAAQALALAVPQARRPGGAATAASLLSRLEARLQTAFASADKLSSGPDGADGPTPPSIADRQASPGPEAQAHMRELARLLASNNALAYRAFESLKDAMPGQEDQARLEAIGNALESLDFAAARAGLDELVTRGGVDAAL